MFKLSQRSQDRLTGVHPDLVRVVRRAIELSDVDFGVTEGVRSLKRQEDLIKSGASRLTNARNGRHITGHAVDLAAFVNGEVRWDWPLYYRIASAMKAAAQELGVAMDWGGDWKGQFKDGPHFELNRKAYP